MQTLRHILVLLAIVAGISANVEPLKTQLLRQLDSYEHRAQPWVNYYGNQGFIHYVNVLKTYQNELRLAYVEIANMQESVVAANSNQLTKIVNETITSIDFKNPDPYEDLKASALYSAVEHEYLSADYYAQNVLNNISMIIRKENEIKTKNPLLVNDLDKMELRTMYDGLKRMISDYHIPKHSDFLTLANVTQMNIDALIEDGNRQTAEELSNNLTQFNTLTRSLAQQIPIEKIEMIQNYISLAKKHHSVMEIVNEFPAYYGQYMDRLSYRLKACEKKLNASRTDFIVRGNTYFADQILEVITRVKYLSKHVEELSFYHDRDQTVESLFDDVKTVEAMTASVVVNPAPEQSLLAGALYLAAERTTRPVSDNFDINASEIIKKAKIIAEQENDLKLRSSESSFDRLHVAFLQTSIKQSYKELKQLIAGHDLPTLADNDKFIKKVADKIDELRNNKMGVVANAYQNQLNTVVHEINELNKIFPLNSDERIDTFFATAENHYYAVTQLDWIFKKN